MFFPFPVGFFHALAFVVLFFAFGQADVHFDVAAFVVHIERDEGIAAAFDFADLLFLAILALPFRTNCEIVGIIYNTIYLFICLLEF